MENNNKNNMILQGLKKRTTIIGFALLLFLGGIIIFSDITKPYTFEDGDIISAEQMNENLDILYAKVNELEALIPTCPPCIPDNVPIGTILPFGGDTVPDGWLLCNGSAYSISGTYAALYEVIGSNFGFPSPGEFYVPDLRGMFLRGVDNSKGVDPDAATRTALQSGGNIGDNVGSMQEDVLQEHQHTFNDTYWGDDSVVADGSKVVANDTTRHVNDTTTGISNGRISDETRPKNVYVNFIIKY